MEKIIHCAHCKANRWYRPISLLPIVSKVLESVQNLAWRTHARYQTISYTREINSYHSAFKTHHSVYVQCV